MTIIPPFIDLLTWCVAQAARYIFDRHTYHNAKPEKQSERLYLTFFFGNWYHRTNITISRANMYWFAAFKNWPFGWAVEGVIVVPLLKDSHGKYHVPIGTRSKCRRVAWYYDIGANGMCDASHTPTENAQKELHEELGINIDLSQVNHTVFGLSDEYSAIIHLFWFELSLADHKDKLKSTDGTFESIQIHPLNADEILRRHQAALNDTGSTLSTFTVNGKACLRYLHRQVHGPRMIITNPVLRSTNH